jgi:hypothetical protein
LKLDLLNKEIQDQHVRENFVRIKRELETQQILSGFWRFFEIDFSEVGVKIPFKHNLSFVPRDIIILSREGSHNLYFNYQDFDSTNIYVTNSGPCRVRFLAGRYEDKAYGGSKKDFAFVSPPSVEVPTWYSGAGNPDTGLGLAGDFYLNTDSSEVFLKVGSTWVTKGFLTIPVPTTERQILEKIAVSVLANTWTLVPLADITMVADITVFDSAGSEEVHIDYRLISAGTQVEIRSKKINTFTVHVEGYK